MILRRLGNKTKIALEIQKHFPEHKLYVELFFGAGGMFFNKPKAKYNILNDGDSDVYNLFQVVRERPEDLIKAWQEVPLHEDLWNNWKRNQEADPVWKACRFLMLSNFGYMGKGNTFRWVSGNSQQRILDMMGVTRELLFGVEFMNTDFRVALRRIPSRALHSNGYTFVYADPPYLGTAHNYQSGFTEDDSRALFACLSESQVKWAMSEFDHPLILELAKDYGCKVHVIGERKNLMNRRTEILVTNY